jgi:glycosyltransferase involved in cell wall biosynthesis
MIKIGIDASNIGYGGGFLHLYEILNNFNSNQHNISKIIIWGDKSLDQLPNFEWLEKRKPNLLLKGGFINKSFWKLFIAKKDIFEQCDILFAPGGTFYSKKTPYVSMSQNMLAFEKIEAKRYGLSIMYIRFLLLNIIQKKSFKNAKGVIFISQYAQNYINKKVSIKNSKLIPHGISDAFFQEPKIQKGITDYSEKNPYKILYVSAIRPYKHQKILIKAAEILIKRYPIELILIGQPEDKTEVFEFEKELNKIPNYKPFIKYLGALNHKEVINYYKTSNIFAMSSTCENMPNILIEAMAAGLPIVSSDYGPMPEFLKDGGIYYNPLDEKSVAETLEKLILNPKLRYENALKAFEYAKQYSWEKCANQTFEYIKELSKK